MVQSVKRDKKDRVLSIRDLNISFKTNYGVVNAIRGVRLDLFKGETIAIVGESGSGKSVTCKTIMGILDSNGIIDSGEITLFYKDENGNEKTADLTKMSQKQIRYEFCGRKIAMVFQDPMACLNPRKKVKEIIAQGLEIHHVCSSQKEVDEKVYAILEKVGLSKEQATRFPSQFSGGQRQRVGIARALVMNPKLVIADECISALDVSIQAQVVNLMKDLQEELGTTYLFIAHDLSMVKYISDRIGIMHLGHIVETGTTDEIFTNPIHPYTKSLLSAIPHPNPIVEKNRVAITYDKEKEGVDYTKGVQHKLTDTHIVLATDEEFSRWTK